MGAKGFPKPRPKCPERPKYESESKGEISDGYHTFNELYHHRNLLFINLMISNPFVSWRAKIHHDGSMFDDSFIAGINLSAGDITYHLPLDMWSLLGDRFDIATLDKAPEWDGHSPDDVLKRLKGAAIGQ